MMSAIVSQSKAQYKRALLTKAKSRLDNSASPVGRVVLATEEERKRDSRTMTPGSFTTNRLVAGMGAGFLHTIAFSRAIDENICFQLFNPKTFKFSLAPILREFTDYYEAVQKGEQRRLSNLSYKSTRKMSWNSPTRRTSQTKQMNQMEKDSRNNHSP